MKSSDIILKFYITKVPLLKNKKLYQKESKDLKEIKLNEIFIPIKKKDEFMILKNILTQLFFV